MKTLLALIGSSILGTVAPLSVISTVSQLSAKSPKINKDDAADNSSAVAKALIEKVSKNNLNSANYLQYEEFNNSKLGVSLNKIFGGHDSSDLNSWVASTSKIKDSDGTNSGIEFNPEMGMLNKILDSFLNSKTSSSPSTLMDMSFLADLPKVVGSILSQFLGTTSPMFGLISHIPLTALIDAIDTFRADYSPNLVYGTFQNPDDYKGRLAILNSNTVLAKAYGYLFNGGVEFLGKGQMKLNWTNIAKFFCGVINYISQYTFDSDAKIGGNLFDPKSSNALVHKIVDQDIIQPTNWTNLSNLLENIMNYNKNDGVGFAQLIDVLFGSHNDNEQIGVSSSFTNNIQAHIDNSVFDVKYLSIILQPNLSYLNPIIGGLNDWLQNKTFLASLLKYLGITDSGDSALIYNTLTAMYDSDTPLNLLPQMVTLMGGLADNIANNHVIDNEFVPISALLDGWLYYANVATFQSLSHKIFKKTTKLINFNNFIKNYDSFYKNSYLTDKGWCDPDDEAAPYAIWGQTGRAMLYGAWHIDPTQKLGNSWYDFFNGKIGWYYGFQSAMNILFAGAESNLALPKSLPSLKSILDNIFNKKMMSNSNLTFGQIIDEVDKKGGLFSDIQENIKPIVQMTQSLLNAMINPKTIKEGIDWISSNIDATKDKTGKIASLESDLLTANKNVGDILAIIAIASSQNAFITGSNADLANAEFFKILGYDVNTGQATLQSDTIYSTMQDNWPLIKTLIGDVNTTLHDLLIAPFLNALKDWKGNDIADVEIDKNYNITYKLKDSLDNAVYDVELIYNAQTSYYQISVNKE